MANTVTDTRLSLPIHSKLAVLGSPIAHSKSPLIHAAAYQELGLGWEYERRELQASDLQRYLASLSEDWRGLSLTMPLKEQAHRLAAVLDPVAQESGVVNTLFRVTGSGDGAAWAGFNTDVGGLAAAIRREGLDATRTVIFGAGATAVSAVLAARLLGATHVTVLARNREAAVTLAERFHGTHEPGGAPITVNSGALFAEVASGGQSSERERAQASLIISTLPAPHIDWRRVAQLGSAPTFDVAYDPWPSALAKVTEAAGMTARSGAGMLVEQALLQIRIFVNGDPSLVLDKEAAVRNAMYRAVGM